MYIWSIQHEVFIYIAHCKLILYIVRWLLLLLFSCPIMSNSLWPPWTAAHQAFLSFTISQSLPNSRPLHNDGWLVGLVAKSCPTLATPWTLACQAPLSMGFSRQEYWSEFAISFSRGSSWPRDQTQISCIAGRCFTLWATRANIKTYNILIRNTIKSEHKVKYTKSHWIVYFKMVKLWVRKLNLSEKKYQTFKTAWYFFASKYNDLEFHLSS